MVRVLRMRVLLGAFLVAAMAGLFSARSGLFSAALSDVPSGHPFATAIAYVQGKGIISGNPDGTFRPGGMVNRAEFTHMVVKSVFPPEAAAQCLAYIRADLGQAHRFFADVPSGSWYEGSLCIALAYGYVTGYPDGTFRPGGSITLAEAAKILSAAFELDIFPTAGSDWYSTYVAALASRGAIPLGIAGPETPLIRGEVAEMLYRLHAGVTDLPSSTGERYFAAAPVRPSDAHASGMFDLVNATRKQNGLPPFAYNPLLEWAAQEQAKYMAVKNVFSHFSAAGLSAEDRVASTGYLRGQQRFSIGENIAETDMAPEQVVALWMASPQHKANILSTSFRDIGIAHEGDKWVLVFGERG